jgi:hypothetical protein
MTSSPSPRLLTATASVELDINDSVAIFLETQEERNLQSLRNSFVNQRKQYLGRRIM